MNDKNKAALSARQAEIVQLIAAGKSSNQIAEVLFLSPRTVDNHVAAALAKLGVRSRVELVATLLRRAGAPNNAE